MTRTSSTSRYLPWDRGYLVACRDRRRPYTARRIVALRGSHEWFGQESRARLFRRPRYLRDPALAAGHLQMRGRDLHGRPRPGRGFEPGAEESRRSEEHT